MGSQPVWIWDGQSGVGSGQGEWIGAEDESSACEYPMLPGLLGEAFGVVMAPAELKLFS